MNRLGDVRGLNVFGAGEVGDGAAYFKHAAVGAGAQPKLVDGGFQELVSFFLNDAIALDVFGTHLTGVLDYIDFIAGWTWYKIKTHTAFWINRLLRHSKPARSV